MYCEAWAQGPAPYNPCTVMNIYYIEYSSLILLLM